ncbi:MAG: spermidine synthase [Deltaproteobacteria bacterium]|jgi:spermidine synthase|nr:spermidine synthase [Deltaproteobacteria bacterium]
MSKAWETLDQQLTSDGVLELRRRDADDFLILVAGRVLMNSRASASEEELGRWACEGLSPGSKVLVGGLGMGMTLRAVLDSLPAEGAVTVAELHPVIVEWCRGPLADLTGSAATDPRVTTKISDVADCIREASEGRRGGSHTGEGVYDAIVLDLFEGPHARTHATRDPLYGREAIERTWHALSPGGVLGVWAEAPDRGFEARLERQGFAVETRRPGRGGLRHWIVLARRPRSSSRTASRADR